MMIKRIVKELPTHPVRTYNKRALSDLKYIVLHHTVGVADIEAFANYHVSKGWPGIGYHFVIDKEGKVFMTNDLDTISYNVAKNNTKCLGIAVVGDYEKNLLSSAQKRAITFLVNTLKALLGNLPVKGHNEFKPTLCPGKNITEFIKKFN